MDITPIFELRNQLRAAAIAGANLISENFRLKKSVDAFEPIKAASPVFGKIYELSASLVSGDCEDTAGTLLDTITLVDSVVCTLASSAVPGAVEELPITEFSATVTNAPYSELSALIDALTSSGSGKYELVSNTRTDRPELFNDYRVKPALVKGLGASYSELAVLAAKILEDMGEGVVSLLKKDFDPKGKKEMVRRVNVIENVCGASENAFYLEQLENAEKDVRKALIYALRHDEANIDKLAELTKTEKGKVKTAALSALANFDCEKSAAFFDEYMKKKPLEVVKIMENVSSKWASVLTVRLIDSLLIDDKGNRITFSQAGDFRNIKLKEKTGFPELNSALWGKWGEDVEKIYREFDNKNSARQMSVRLGDSIIVTKNESLKALAIEMNSRLHKGNYDYADAVARFMSSDDISNWMTKQVAELKRQTVTDPKAVNKSDFARVLRMITFKNGGYVLTTQHWDEMAEMWRDISVPVSHPIKQLADIIIKHPNEYYNTTLLGWLDPDDRGFCDKIGQFYVDQFMKNPQFYLNLFSLIRRTGLKNVKGLARRFFEFQTLPQYSLHQFFLMLPGDNEYRLAEAREIIELKRKGKLKAQFDVDELSAWAETELKF